MVHLLFHKPCLLLQRQIALTFAEGKTKNSLVTEGKSLVSTLDLLRTKDNLL